MVRYGLQARLARQRVLACTFREFTEIFRDPDTFTLLQDSSTPVVSTWSKTEE